MIKIAKDTALLYFSTLATALCTFISEIIIRNLLGPVEHGIWLTISLFIIYGHITQLGVINGLNKEIPQLLAQGRGSQAQIYREVVKGWMIIPFVISLIIILIVYFNYEGNYKFFIILSLFTIPIQQILTFYKTLFITSDNFKIISLNQILTGPVQSILSVILVYYFRLPGLLLSINMTSILAVVSLHFRYPNKIKVQMNTGKIKYLMSFGFPIMIIGLAWVLFTTVDRMMISYFWNPLVVGYYGIAILTTQVILMFPQALNVVLYRKISFSYGLQDTGKLKSLIYKPTITLAYVFPCIIGCAYILLPIFVEYFMIDYVEGITTGQLSLFGCFFLVLVGTYANYLNSAAKHYSYLVLLFFCIFLNGILNYIVIYMDMGISQISLATTISSFCFFILIKYRVYKELQYSNKVFKNHLIIIVLPFVIMCILLLSIELLVTMSLIIKLFIYFISYFLGLYYIIKHFKFNIVFETIESIRSTVEKLKEKVNKNNEL